MESIKFNHNWNNKLDCKCFTTVRLKYDAKYFVGAKFSVDFKGKFFYVIVRDVRHFMLKDLDLFTAMLDTGYSTFEFRNIIRTMYPRIDFSQQQLSCILLEKI